MLSVLDGDRYFFVFDIFPLVGEQEGLALLGIEAVSKDAGLRSEVSDVNGVFDGLDILPFGVEEEDLGDLEKYQRWEYQQWQEAPSEYPMTIAQAIAIRDLFMSYDSTNISGLESSVSADRECGEWDRRF